MHLSQFLIDVFFFCGGIVIGALIFRKNPLRGARTLDELNGWYEEAKTVLKKTAARL